MAYIKQEDILAATNGGLDIIFYFYPQAIGCERSSQKKFKLREEKTASANLRKAKDGNWICTDFGGDNIRRNAIGVAMLELGKDPPETCAWLCKEFNIKSGDFVPEEIKPEISATTAKKEQGEGYHEVKVTEFTEAHLRQIFSWNVFNRYHNPAKNINDLKGLIQVCKDYHFYALESYSFVKDRRLITIKSTDKYRIYMFDEGSFKKIYQPNSADKGHRFRTFGELPDDFMYGMDAIKKAKKKAEENYQADRVRQAEDSDEDPEVTEGGKMEAIIVGSGGTDSLNLAALGFYPAWHNSETANFTEKQFNTLKTYAKVVYHLSDIDAAGIDAAHKACMNFLDLRAIRLPDELRKISFKGSPGKDFRDYMNHFRKKDFVNLMNTAKPYQFWDVRYEKDSKGEFKKLNYAFNNAHCYNFLQGNGYFRYRVEGEKEGFIYVHVNGNIVRKLESIVEIKDYINGFVKSRHLPIPLQNMLHKTNQLGENSMSNLEYVNLDFDVSDPEAQYFFFKNKTVKASAGEIKEFRPGQVKKHVWDEKVHDCHFKLLPPSFEVYEDDNKNLRLKIHNQNSPFFKFLVNSSRVYWRTEEEGVLVIENGKDTGEIRKELTDEEKAEQEYHLLNKMYALGYMLHRHKFRFKAWAVFVMDDKVSQVGESHGGSGKSAYGMALLKMLNTKTFNGRLEDLTDNRHIMQGVTKHTDMLFFDECSQYFKFKVFFSYITGSLQVNPKNAADYTIPFEDAPKFLFISNYTLYDVDPSTARRLLYVAFCDYYHHNHNGEYKESRSIYDDLGMQLFDDFTDEHWNMFYNDMIYFTQLYLRHHKIDPPMKNLELRNLISDMGDTFKNWADAFFSEISGNRDKLLVRKDVFDIFAKETHSLKWSTQKFTKAIIAWCKFYRFTYNPADLRNGDGNIVRKDDKGTAAHFIYVQTKTKINAPKLDDQGNEVKPDLPF